MPSATIHLAQFPAWSEVVRTLTLREGFNTTMVITGTALLGLAAGVVGAFMLLRKRALVADAIGHSTLPGVAGAFLAVSALELSGRSLPVLLVGATLAGLLGAGTIQAIVRWTRLAEDAAIAIVLSVFFGAGVVLLSIVQQQPGGGAAGLSHFIFGQAASMVARDAILMGAIALVAVTITTLFLKELALVTFNDDFARVLGWPVTLIDLLMMLLVVVVTVAGLQAVGIILVVSMLIIPPVAARFWTDRLSRMLIVAGAIGALSGYIGSALSALFPRQPAGAVIVLTSGAIFLLSMLCAPKRGIIASAIRRVHLTLRVAGEHLLEYAHERGGAPIERGEVRRRARLRDWPGWTLPLLRIMLLKKGYLAAGDQGAWTMTERGLKRGAQISRNHQLWEQYLVSYADIAPSHVDWSVDQVEHVLTPELVNELETKLATQKLQQNAEATP